MSKWALRMSLLQIDEQMIETGNIGLNTNDFELFGGMRFSFRYWRSGETTVALECTEKRSCENPGVKVDSTLQWTLARDLLRPWRWWLPFFASDLIYQSNLQRSMARGMPGIFVCGNMVTWLENDLWKNHIAFVAKCVFLNAYDRTLPCLLELLVGCWFLVGSF